MFQRLGSAVAARPWLVIAAWLIAAVAVRGIAPCWDDITHDGDLAYLPERLPSVAGDKLLGAAFPENRAKSQMVIVIARDGGPLELADLEFGDELAARFAAKLDDPAWPLADVWSRKTEVFGAKLRSVDKQAQLIVLQLTNEFMATDNVRVLALVEEELAAARQRLTESGPHGLTIGLSGSAAVGGDMLLAASESIRNTEWLTVVLVLAILLAVYRAPLLLLVPLVSIVASLTVATGLLALLTQLSTVPGFEWWDFKVFKTTRIFIVVILYGSGTDFCLFLISRYREELAAGKDRRQALADALSGVGDALLGSALTTVLGLGAMYFAEFGKFRNSGPAIGLCLLVTLAACLTLAPALLAASGAAIFWPRRRAFLGGTVEARGSAEAIEAIRGGVWDRLWNRVADVVIGRPLLILTLSSVGLAPLAWHGARAGDRVTYDLLSELAPSRVSKQGSELLRSHFPVGEGGPILVLARRPGAGFGSEDRQVARDALAEIADLTSVLRELDGVHLVRSLAEPLGDAPRKLSMLSSAGRQKLFLQNHRLTKQIFLSQGGGELADVARFELVLNHDPFSNAAIEVLDKVERRLAELAARDDSFWRQATFHVAGTTASIRDLKSITGSDHVRIQWLVTLAVFAVLLAIVRRPVACVVLIVTVLFSYWVTIGVTQIVFEQAYGETFSGLDWKVPTFLFVILVAVGEDYNIYLATRVFEEQERLGPAAGLRFAMRQTGGIITSCGVIMAGTFV
ncbi:MAG TPA: MMPL family transporter, partial [Pirellulaceae bacterium]|nr:MMPL family transporter [Pirellulaceae bacterium]